MMVVEDKALYIKYCQMYNTTLPIFYTAPWLDVVCNKKWKPFMLTVDGKAKAIFPFYLKRKFGLTAAAMPPLTPYLAMWILDESDRNNYDLYLSAFISFLPNAIFMSFSSHIHFDFHKSWQNKGYEIKKRNTYIFEAQPYETIFQNFQSKMKNDLRFAAERVEVIEQTEVNDLLKMIDLTFESQEKKSPHATDVIKRINEDKSIHSTILSATLDKRSVASIMVVEDYSTVYYLLSGRSSEAPRGTIALLINQAIKHAMIQNKGFDFEGSSIPGIAAFFRSFGAQHKNFFNASKFKYNWLKYIATFVKR
jgi:hypothetical protein